MFVSFPAANISYMFRVGIFKTFYIIRRTVKLANRYGGQDLYKVHKCQLLSVRLMCLSKLILPFDKVLSVLNFLREFSIFVILLSVSPERVGECWIGALISSCNIPLFVLLIIVVEGLSLVICIIVLLSEWVMKKWTIDFS